MGADEAGHGHRQTGNEDAKQQGDTTNRSRYRRATLLILTGSLTFLVSLAVLLFMNPSPEPTATPPEPTATPPDPPAMIPEAPGGRVGRQPPGPSSDLPRLPDESLKEYIFRTDADEREATARSRLWAAIAAFDPAAPLDANGQTALQAELREIAVLLDEARRLREFGERARIEAELEGQGPLDSLRDAEAPTDSLRDAEAPTDSSAEAAPLRVEEPGRETPSTSGGDGTETVVTIAGVVALVTAIAGLVAAVAGLFTALATWIKARRQPASTDTSASG